MKPGFAFGDVFWGVSLIVLGILAILRVHFPIFRILVALFFIYLGLSMLLGWFAFKPDRNTVFFMDGVISASDQSEEYNVVFGRATIDLSGISPEKNPNIEVNAVFGSATMKVDPTIPVRITASTAFGRVELPDGGLAAFGERTYKSRGFQEGQPHILVKANAVFGSIEIVER